MKRASYRAGVKWIAEEDEAGGDGALDPEVVSYYVTSLLLAELFGKEPEEVGAAIVRCRKKIRALERKSSD